MGTLTFEFGIDGNQISCTLANDNKLAFGYGNTRKQALDDLIQQLGPELDMSNST